MTDISDTKSSKSVVKKDTSKISTKEARSKRLSLFSGSRDKAFTNTLLNQVLNATRVEYIGKTGSDFAMGALMGMGEIKPRDALEGMLVAQMSAIYHASMECFRIAMLEIQTCQGRQDNLNQANKLVRSYAVLLESLQRYRGKGESRQKVTVKHVHVHEGGQAIVGNIEPRA